MNRKIHAVLALILLALTALGQLHADAKARKYTFNNTEIKQMKWTDLIDLETDLAEVGHGELQTGMIKIEKKRIKVDKKTIKASIFAHAPSKLVYNIEEKEFQLFRGYVGLKDGSRGKVRFKILGDGEDLWKSPVIDGKNKPKRIKKPYRDARTFSINITGIKKLELIVTEEGNKNSDHSIWVEPRLGKIPEKHKPKSQRKKKKSEKEEEE